jgi:hypothetical protein
MRKGLISAVCAAALVPQVAGAAQLLTGEDLGAALFDGRTIHSTDTRGRGAELAFSPGGKVAFKPASGEARAGTWRASEEGFCMTLGGRGRERCYLVLRSNNGDLRAVGLDDAFAWSLRRPDQAAAVEPVSGLAGSQP